MDGGRAAVWTGVPCYCAQDQPKVNALTREFGARIASLERQLAERTSNAEKVLRALTPGGSEFQTVDECAQYVRDERASTRETIVRFKKRADAAEERLRRVREAIDRAVESDSIGVLAGVALRAATEEPKP